jgi:hypothetical protein
MGAVGLRFTGLESVVEADAVGELHLALDDRRLTACWADGRQLGFDDAVGYARGRGVPDTLLATL